ncbi:imidazole glycerol phosphate synthase subunit HisF [Pseudoalteromonas sp. McH1-7]|uniref:Imidazole glycerol phosphate synthase subunit HisF n=1 Tax=Pseudoalteromonas peptidolytica F12-50-A1 TaxID=1315280 RepID=A0A8I0N0M3_9GAMM|nr:MULTISPECIES: imidazole glycerol phosphate synthase subunit HisF [Pseudoalteromonas]MBE0348777.1 cyclase [Pseudoalteromonas peptidolytica F12-50-A1]NLR15069.1 imidazole glycerol phosphate synthase subunit HisF [Pseudoalteromonas peptidolytica]NUZ10232.1 imidazole glycerol phosphate synthase subunit HisF [Pseudoalteromonas sp. McH1-7]USD30624.1 imidazole glycerol phosphate synthase subunit HisF [Pseudoalteromonas sp. SCSIO 43201]GEK09371.1 imidazole glycerol phosphate synthase subunit HisF [
MLSKRIIPCLDVKDGQVVKGVKFQGHEVVGDILELAERYSAAGADELVFYEISASVEKRLLDVNWVAEIARHIEIPFCVAGGIKSVADAARVLEQGADKISINSPAIARPELIKELHDEFGKQCVVVGIDSFYDKQTQEYLVYQLTGDPNAASRTRYKTQEWVKQVQALGAGEIVLNCMNQDGVRNGYDIEQLSAIRELCKVPLIASGGAGSMQDFVDVFTQTNVDGALAASVFHKGVIEIPKLKQFLINNDVAARQ